MRIATSPILAVDIGNTAIHVGLFDRGRITRQLSVPTAWARHPVRLRQALGRIALRRAECAILCSVVPRATAPVARALRAVGCSCVCVVGKDIKVPLKNRYRKPQQVGQDRLVGAYAAWFQYGRGQGTGGKRRDCIICDFGTAVTIDLVTARGEYLGGVIAPGLELSLRALAERTALLPRVKLAKPPEPLGRTTEHSIQAGAIYGAATLCDGLVGLLKARYAPSAVVVATGGAAGLVAPLSRTIQHVQPHLVLQGLYRLAV